MIGKIKFKDILNELSKRELKLANLEKENAELKADFIKSCKVKEQGFREAEQALERKDEYLTKAKDIIKNIIQVTWGEGWNYSLDWKVKAEQFLKELSK